MACLICQCTHYIDGKLIADQLFVFADNIKGAEGLNPLATNQMPSENSNNATGTAVRTARGSNRPIRPNNTEMKPITSIGTPTNPIIESVRGTKRDLYNR